jgi:hypothetical protein
MSEVIYKWFSSKRAYGVEIEVSNNVERSEIYKCITKHSKREVVVTSWDQSYNNNYWHIKQDSTCGPNAHIHKDYGVEIATFLARGYKDLKHIAEIVDALTQIGVCVNNNCGLHVHVSVGDFSTSQMGVLFAYWMKIEPIICCMVANRRLADKHCKLWHTRKGIDKNRQYTPDHLWNMIAPTNFSPHNNRQKKVALNFVNYAAAIAAGHNRPTVELRLPEGTLSSRSISAWVRIFISFVESCRNLPMPLDLRPVVNLREFFEIIGLADKQKFTFLSDGYSDSKLWVLEQILSSTHASQRTWGRSIQKQARNMRENLVLKVA